MKTAIFGYFVGLVVGYFVGVWVCTCKEMLRILSDMKESLKRWA